MTESPTDVKIVKQLHGKEVYLMSDLRCNEDDEDLRQGNSFSKTSMKLLKVSFEKIEDQH